MPPTQKGIYHNLKESKYTISNNEVVFYFSSKVYMHKYLDSYKEFRSKFNNKLKGIPYNMDIVADINLYEEIEKRGFHVKLFGETVDYNDLCKYGLRCMTKETLDWHEINYKEIGRLKYG